MIDPAPNGEGGEPQSKERQWWKRIPKLAWAAVGGIGLLLGILAALNSLGWPPFEKTDLPDVRVDAAASRFGSGGAEPSAEYVCLVNADDQPVQLASWELRDSLDHVIVLGAFLLEPGAAVRVHTGNGKPAGNDLFGGLGSTIWNDDGDTVTLIDAEGVEIDSETYREGIEPGDGRPCGVDTEQPNSAG